MARKQKWADLSGRQRAAIIIGGAIQVSLLVAAQADIRRRPAQQIRGSKKLWSALAFVNYVGPIAYFVFGRKKT